MNQLILRTLFDHGNWATRRVFDVARRLDDKALDRSIDTLGSIRALLFHLVDAHGYWLARARGGEPQTRITAVEKPGVEALFAEWERLEVSASALLSRLDDTDLQRIVRYTNPSGAPQAYPLWMILSHQLLHAAQHRSELALMLSQHGHSPGWLDLLVFVDELSAATNEV